ncbi:MAG: hypothetical protein ACE5Z5_01835 [Candidatus Bathyarchaeia archaeon]
MTKTVQTALEEDEYRLFKEVLAKKKWSIREGLRIAVARLVEEEMKLDPDDPFFTHKAMGRSGLGDLSERHDEYLYGGRRQ